MRLTIILTSVAFWCQSIVSAAPSVVRSTLEWNAPSPLGAGGTGQLRLTVKIRDGYHIFPLDAADGSMAATEIRLVSPGLKQDGVIDAPPPREEHNATLDRKLRFYTGVVTFLVPFVATKDLPPDTSIELALTYQACSSETCLLPKTDRVTCAVAPQKSH